MAKETSSFIFFFFKLLPSIFLETFVFFLISNFVVTFCWIVLKFTLSGLEFLKDLYPI